jgi:hypothetical protein
MMPYILERDAEAVSFHILLFGGEQGTHMRKTSLTADKYAHFCTNSNADL